MCVRLSAIQKHRLAHMEHGFSQSGQWMAAVDAQTAAERMDRSKGSVMPIFYLGPNTTVVLQA